MELEVGVGAGGGGGSRLGDTEGTPWRGGGLRRRLWGLRRVWETWVWGKVRSEEGRQERGCWGVGGGP